MTTDEFPKNNGNNNLITFLPIELYLNLIKGKQTVLLVYTAGFAYLITSIQYQFDIIQFSWLLVAMFFAVSGSTLFNMFIDKDIDKIMERTKDRPLPSGKIAGTTVVKHAIFFTGASLIISWLFLDPLTTIVIFLGAFFDVVIYSYLLKRRTKYSILFGGIAGGLPALAGRTAIIMSIDAIGILLSLFVIAWIPLHILTLALLPKNLEGYRKAKVPMWPVVSSEKQTIYVISFSAFVSAMIAVFVSVLLEIDFILRFPLVFFSAYILALAFENFLWPTTKRTFKIFKAASIYMVLTFLLLFIGLLITTG